MLERLRAALFENLSLKLVSLAIALIVYAMVHGGQDLQRTFSSDLVVLPPPESANRVLVSALPPHVRVTLRGPKAAMDELRAEDLGSVQVDLRSGQDRRVVFDASMIPLPANVVVDRFDPSFVEFKFEDQIVRDVPIQVGLVGAPAPGFVVKGAPSPEPATARARGPKSEVLVLQHAKTNDPFDVSGLALGTHKRSLAIEKPQSGRVSFDAPIVEVTVEITRQVIEKIFNKLPVAVVGAPKGRTQPAEVDVRLVCPPDIIHALRAEQLVPQVAVPPPHAGADAQGSQSFAVELAVEGCETHITPKTVVVRW